MSTLLVKPCAKCQQYGATERLSAIEPPLWLAIMANRYEDPLIWDMEAETVASNSMSRRMFYQTDADLVVILATGSHPSAHIQQQDAMKVVQGMAEACGKRVEIHDRLNFDPIETGQPRWDLLKMANYRAHNWHCWGFGDRNNYGAVYTSVSCPFNCDFCAIKPFYHTPYKKRPIVEFLKDIHKQYSDYGIRNYKILDELFGMSNNYTTDLCQELAMSIGNDINLWGYARIDTVTPEALRLMRNAGVRWLAYGIESGNDAIRQEMNKGRFNRQKIKDVVQMTKDADINVLGNYMFGFWEDTMDTMQETLDFAIELNCEFANFYCVTAYPNTKLYDMMKDQGVTLPRRSVEYAQLSPEFRPMPTKTVPASKVLKFRDDAFLIYFKNSHYRNMMNAKFGKKVVQEIETMTRINIERKVLK